MAYRRTVATEGKLVRLYFSDLKHFIGNKKVANSRAWMTCTPSGPESVRSSLRPSQRVTFPVSLKKATEKGIAQTDYVCMRSITQTNATTNKHINVKYVK